MTFRERTVHQTSIKSTTGIQSEAKSTNKQDWKRTKQVNWSRNTKKKLKTKKNHKKLAKQRFNPCTKMNLMVVVVAIGLMVLLLVLLRL